MITTRMTQTVIVKQCNRCAAELPTSDNFCRWCGNLQRVTLFTATNSTHSCECQTKALRDDEPTFQMLSGALVNTLTRNIAVKVAPLRSNRFGSRVVTAIIAIPIWLLIVLLSPLDAYAAAKFAKSKADYQ